MSSVFLADFIDNAQDDLQLLIPAALKGELDFRGLQVLCGRFRQRGACTFFLAGNSEAFFVNAMQSGGAYSALLGSIPDAQKVTSQATPFYDAVGCGFWECAGNIARLSRAEWNPDKEYEDDFLFVMFLMKHFFLGADENEARALLERHESVAEGKDEAHRAVCRSFLDRDSDVFDQALRDLLQQRAERVEAMVARNAMPEEHWSWLRYFSSEGFALLKLADRSGLRTATDYLHVSEALRHVPESLVFDPEAWKDLTYGA